MTHLIWTFQVQHHEKRRWVKLPEDHVKWQIQISDVDLRILLLWTFVSYCYIISQIGFSMGFGGKSSLAFVFCTYNVS
jgi:hypothetical protein